MRRIMPWVLLLLTGCTTAPCADTLDFVYPGKIRYARGRPYGGVCRQQGGAAALPLMPVPTGPMIAPLPPAAPGGTIPAPAPPGFQIVPQPLPRGPGAPVPFPG